MRIDIPSPDDVVRIGDDFIPVWTCPKCGEGKAIEEFGLRKRDDIHPGQDVFHKQSWCKGCRKPG